MNKALPRIQKMSRYKPPLENRSNFDGLLLDFNERPVDPEFLKAVYEEVVENCQIHLYPQYSGLEKAIAEYAGVGRDNVIATAGSDQAIDLVFRTFSDKDDEVIIPSPSFAMFYQSALAAGPKLIKPTYKITDLSFPMRKVMESINSRTKIVTICNPNNPTGGIVSIDAIEKIAKKASRAIVLIDEAYFEFSGISAVPLLSQYPNIVIARTFSKAFGLAGLRIGYLIGNQENLKEIRKLRGPYAVSAIAAMAAKKALENKSEMRDYAKEVMQIAKPFVEKFLSRNKIKYYESSANFVLIKPKNPDEVYESLKNNGVLVRPRNEAGIKGTIRVTVTTFEQMTRFCEVYQKVILDKGDRL